jgi:2,3-bisphosphoglycerate-dependent phosphoglycerate mutase
MHHSRRGRVQADALADFLAARAIARIVSSPYLRARQSIEPLARGLAAIRPLLELPASDGLVVIVSHGQLISLALHSIDPSFGFAGWEALSNPDVHTLEATAKTGLAFRRVWR